MPDARPRFGDPPPWDGPVQPPRVRPPAKPMPGLPDPGEFNPFTDPFPSGPGIPDILEWKLDVLIAMEARQVWFLNQIMLVLLWGFGGVFVALTIIPWALGNLLAMLAMILFLLLFIVIRVVVPFLRRQR
jgi:hypothetical protein